MPRPSPMYGYTKSWQKRHVRYDSCQLERLTGGALVRCDAPTENGARHCPKCFHRLLTKFDPDVSLQSRTG